MENKQTAVEWLVEKLMKGEFINSPDELIQQAKQMEKEQIMKAFEYGIEVPYMEYKNGRSLFIKPENSSIKSEEYYNETYQ